MNVLRTPDERFADLKDYPFAPNYVEVGEGLRLHYLDESPATRDRAPTTQLSPERPLVPDQPAPAATSDAPVVLLMHGEPSWSYLYRHMIPPLVEAGYRCIAPDLIGFGRSDKPTEMSDYTYKKHVAWIESLIDQLGLRDINLFCQDWGGLISLRIVASRPELFKTVTTSNTFLPTGEQQVPRAFLEWQKFSQLVDVFSSGGVLQMATTRDLDDEETAAYEAPFPDETYKAGARIFPTLVPTQPDDAEGQFNKRAWGKLAQFDKPFLTLFGDKDPVTRGGGKVFQKVVAGAQGQPHAVIEGGHHFIQEDAPAELVGHLIPFLNQWNEKSN